MSLWLQLSPRLPIASTLGDRQEIIILFYSILVHSALVSKIIHCLLS